MRPMLSTLIRILVAVSILAAAEVAISQPSGEPALSMSAERNQEWARTLEEELARLRASQAQVAELERQITDARRRRYPRGEALGALERELADARKALARSRAALPELVERARRSGVPPGVLRPYEGIPASDR